jgi:sigma-B regulation protein RsbU (phosphoserine phosphatase)
VVGDVSDKGVPAALMMAVTKTLLKSQAYNESSPATIFTRVNNEIAKDNETCMFITVFMAILDTNTGELTYSNAGHNPSYIVNGNRKGHHRLDDLHGPVLGAMEGITYTETRLHVQKDDLIVAYTDGVTEAQNREEELFSEERLIHLLEKESGNSPEEITTRIIKSVESFENGADQFDDITLLAVKYLSGKIEPDRQETFEIENKLSEIADAIDFFSDFGTKNSLSDEVIQKCNIVLDELLNNTISYGFRDGKKHHITLMFELREERLLITIEDDGVPFNPLSKKPPDTDLPIGEREIGGLGIHLAKNLMDTFNYERKKDKNIITLVKNNINKTTDGNRDQNK